MAMFLEITGFLADDSEDDSLKFALNVDSECEAGVMKILGWESLEEEANGELPLTAPQVEAISILLNEPLTEASGYVHRGEAIEQR